MRPVFACRVLAIPILPMSLSIALCASADAAAREPRVHHAKPRQTIIRPGPAVVPGDITPGGVRIYRDPSVPGGLRTDHDPPPSYNDPSKFGGA
jgi:hypothetical protein